MRVCKEVFITDYETCTLRPLNAGYAAEIAQWEYSAPYTAYNFKDHPTDYLMDEKTWGTEQFVLCAEDTLVGQVACQLYEGRFWIGWSQAPVLCGNGGGHLFAKKCVDEIRRVKDFAGTIVLRVAASNVRAIYAYQKAGFVYKETILDEVAYSDRLEDFWVMEIK